MVRLSPSSVDHAQVGESGFDGPSAQSDFVLSNHVHSDLLTPLSGSSGRTELPPYIDLGGDIYRGGGGGGDAVPPIPPAVQQALKGANSVDFTSAAQDQQSGTQPDFFLQPDGKLVPNPKATPGNKDVKIEVQGNKSEIDAKKYADTIQKAQIRDLISMLKASNPRARIPEMWQSILNQQPDLPAPINNNDQSANTQPSDAAPAPQQQAAPVEHHGGGGSSGGGGSAGGGGPSGGGDGGAGSASPSGAPSESSYPHGVNTTYDGAN
ncbi:MAG TPA: hypothetical protein V6C72_12690, partial [Chroococcales cyanobacterium]